MDATNGGEPLEDRFYAANEWPHANPVAYVGAGVIDPPARIHAIYDNIQVAAPNFDERFTSPLNWALAQIGEFCENFNWATEYRPAWAQAAGAWNNPQASPEVRDELIELATLIEYRPGMIGEGLDQRAVIEDYFRGILTYNRQTHPNTSRLMGLAQEASTIAVMRFKLRYMRPRPSQLSPTLLPPVDPPEHGSFPSGHATQSFTMATMLNHIVAALGVEANRFAELEPAHPVRDPLVRNPFFDMAERIARNREVMGLHYPSDSAAGRALGQAVFECLCNLPGIAQVIAEAQGEWG